MTEHFDFRVVWDGSKLILLRPLTQAARNWLHDHLEPDAQYLGANAVIEHRYIEPILLGIDEDGLTIAPLN